ncbi:UNVERIFIED_CONTAM: hypothetical protein HDU68_012037, partial [Siphonaria sp. JEL0065]
LAAPKVQLIAKMLVAILVGYSFYFFGTWMYNGIPSHIVKQVDEAVSKRLTSYYVTDPDSTAYETLSADIV